MNTLSRSGSFSDRLRSTSSARSSVSSAPSSSWGATRAATMSLSGPVYTVSSSSRASRPGGAPPAPSWRAGHLPQRDAESGEYQAHHRRAVLEEGNLDGDVGAGFHVA